MNATRAASWSRNRAQFTPTKGAHCLALAPLGDPPSYVELLTCLE
jgi:hypothetical protein